MWRKQISVSEYPSSSRAMSARFRACACVCVCVCVCVCARARVSTLSTTARIHCPPHSPKTCLVAAQHLMSKGDRSTAEGFRPAADRAAGFKTYEIREQCIHSIVIFAARITNHIGLVLDRSAEGGIRGRGSTLSRGGWQLLLSVALSACSPASSAAGTEALERSTVPGSSAAWTGVEAAGIGVVWQHGLCTRKQQSMMRDTVSAAAHPCQVHFSKSSSILQWI